VVKVIWHKSASLPHMDGSVVFAKWRQCPPHIRDVNETLAYETETFGFWSETRPRPRPSCSSTRPRRLIFAARRDRDRELARPRPRRFSRPSKLNTDAHTNSPIQRHRNCFCAPMHSRQNRVHKLWPSTAWWTDRQTKNSMFLSAPAAGETRAPPNLAWW